MGFNKDTVCFCLVLHDFASVVWFPSFFGLNNKKPHVLHEDLMG